MQHIQFKIILMIIMRNFLNNSLLQVMQQYFNKITKFLPIISLLTLPSIFILQTKELHYK